MRMIAPNPRSVSLLARAVLAVPASAAATRLMIGGSTSVFPLMQQLAAAYHKATHQPDAEGRPGQSDVGISDVERRQRRHRRLSRDPIKGVDPKGLVFTKIARDGVCIITNDKNPVSNLYQQEVEGIFTGQIHDWSEVPARTSAGPIDLFHRDGASGTAGRLPAHIPRRKPEDLAERRRPRNPTASSSQAVIGDEHAIGFVSFAFTAGVHTVGYQGIACNLRNAKSGPVPGRA